MFHQFDQDLVAKFTQQAMEFLTKYQLRTVPINYTIAFDLVSGARKDVVQAIRNLVEVDNHLSESQMEDLYQKFYLNHIQQSEDVLEPLGEILQNIVSVVATNNTGSEEFVEVLNRSKTIMNENPSRETLQPVINGLVEMTERTLAQHQGMLEELNKTKDETQKLKEALEETKLQAMTDPLTKLLNRQGLKQEMKRWQQDVADASLLMIDIDFFKSINDKFGHSVGDKVLTRVAMEIKNNVKGMDLAGRWGGEEFIVLLRDTHIDSAQKVAEHLRANVEALKLVHTRTKEKLPTITNSIGLSENRRLG